MDTTKTEVRKKKRGNNRYPSFEERGVTEAQMQYIKTHYGERPLVMLAQECNLPATDAEVVKNRLKKMGELPDGPGHNWRDTMKAKGYVTRAMPPVSPGGARTAVVVAAQSSEGVNTSCKHHRICVQIGDGRERQTCKLCGHEIIVKVW